MLLLSKSWSRSGIIQNCDHLQFCLCWTHKFKILTEDEKHLDLLFYTFRNLFTLTTLKYHSECNLQLNNSLKFHHQFLLLEHFQGWRKRVGRLGVRPHTFWQNRRRYQAALARRITTCPLRFSDLAPSLIFFYLVLDFSTELEVGLDCWEFYWRTCSLQIIFSVELFANHD